MKKPFSDWDPQIAAEFVKQFELGPKGTVALEAYQCPAGIWTIGWGSTRGVKQGMKITVEDAENRLKRDLISHAKEASSLVKVPVTRGQYIALLDWFYNLGTTRVANSTLLRYLNDGHYALAQTQFKRWVYSNGKVLNGLVRRRDAEAEKFLE